MQIQKNARKCVAEISLNIVLQVPTLQALFNLIQFWTHCIFNKIDVINIL